MAAKSPRSWRRIALQAIAAGIVGGALLEFFLWFMMLRPAGTPVTAMWSLVATQAIGPAIAGNPDAARIGLCIYAIISIVWAAAYAYVASGRAALNARWPVSGIVYGVVVYLFMQIVLLVSGHFEYPHAPNDFVIAVLAHTVFFGLPVAFVVKSLDRA